MNTVKIIGLQFNSKIYKICYEPDVYVYGGKELLEGADLVVDMELKLIISRNSKPVNKKMSDDLYDIFAGLPLNTLDRINGPERGDK